MKKITILLFLTILCLTGCTKGSLDKIPTAGVPSSVTIPDVTYVPPITTNEYPTATQQDFEVPTPTETPLPNTTYSPEDFYIENGDIRVQVYLTTADVTHDGIEDYIETCMYFLPETDFTMNFTEAIQGRLDVADAIVSVYDGSTSSADNLSTPIWSKGYSACHAGNGQVSIVYKDGLAYLLEGCLWQGQGSTGYYHTVSFFDETGLQHNLYEYSLQFYETDYSREEQIQLVQNFREQLEPWFTNAELIVATDVSLSTQFVSTDTKQYLPQDYYDAVWQQWAP